MSINYEAFFDNRLVNTQKKDIWGLQLIKAWTQIKSEMYLMHIFITRLIIFGQILEIPVIVSCESHFERDLSNVWKIDLDPILGIFFLSDMYIVMEIGSHVKMHKVGDIILI